MHIEVFDSKVKESFVCIDGWLIFAKVNDKYESCKTVIKEGPAPKPDGLAFEKNGGDHASVLPRDQL